MIPEQPDVRSGTALHNMSAPPRMTITIQPLRAPTAESGPPAGPAELPGLRCFAHVSLDALLDEVPEAGRAGPRGRRIRALVALSRRALDRDPASSEPPTRRRLELLLDELRENAARLDPRALGLPAFALVRRVRGQTEDPPSEPDPARALALVTRVAGGVFVANRSPRVLDLEAEQAGYWFYAPLAAPRGVVP